MGDRSIAEAVQALAGTQLRDQVFALDAEVISVDIENRTCTCELITGKDPATLPEVRLMAAVDDGVLIIPEIGSIVNIITSVYGEPYVSGYSEVSKIIFMGGDLGGMVKLLSALSSLNTIESDINKLKAAFRSWIVIPSDGGAALKAAASSWASSDIEKTKRADLENPNITQ